MPHSSGSPQATAVELVDYGPEPLKLSQNKCYPLRADFSWVFGHSNEKLPNTSPNPSLNSLESDLAQDLGTKVIVLSG